MRLWMLVIDYGELDPAPGSDSEPEDADCFFVTLYGPNGEEFCYNRDLKTSENHPQVREILNNTRNVFEKAFLLILNIVSEEHGLELVSCMSWPFESEDISVVYYLRQVHSQSTHQVSAEE